MRHSPLLTALLSSAAFVTLKPVHAQALQYLGAAMPPNLSPSQPQGGIPYRDPAGRFSLMVPPGWTATPQANGIVVVNGNVSAAFSPFQGATSGPEALSSISRQYESQWRNFQSVDRGNYTIAGQPAVYAVYTGINPQGTTSLVRLASFSDRSGAYIIVMSAPQNEFNAVSRTLQGMEQSFTTGDGAMPGAFPNNGPNGAPQSGGGALGIRGNIGLNPAMNPGANSGMNPGMNPNDPAFNPNAGPGNYPGSGAASGDRATLGVSTRDVEPADLPRIGINERLGALIMQVAPGSAAERARLAPGDLVLSADKQTIRQHTDLLRIMAGKRPGETLELILMRQGRPVTVQVPLR